MADQRVFDAIFEVREIVSHNDDWSKYNQFVRLKMPPFTKLLSYVTDPNLTSFNASNQWYGIYNQLLQGQFVPGETATDDFPTLIAEKDNTLFCGQITDEYYGTPVTFYESMLFFAPAIRLENNVVSIELAPIMPTQTSFYFSIDGAPAGNNAGDPLHQVGVVADKEDLSVGAKIFIQNTEATITAVTPCVISGVAVDAETRGVYCTTPYNKAVHAFIVSFDNGDKIIVIRLSDVGLLTWQAVIGS